MANIPAGGGTSRKRRRRGSGGPAFTFGPQSGGGNRGTGGRPKPIWPGGADAGSRPGLAGGGNDHGGGKPPPSTGVPAPAHPPTPTPTPGTPSPAVDQNAQVLLSGLLTQWGLGDLSPVVLKYLQQGYQSDAIQYLLSQTPEYEKRFAGNAQRITNGLAPLSPAEYLSTEAAYHQALASSGLPSGFYDQPSDFTNWIGGDVSPNEIQQRAQLASSEVNSADPVVRQQLQSYYGISDSHLAAYFLDSSRALPILQRQAQAAAIGGEAVRQGLTAPTVQHAEQYADMGVSQQQAHSAYQTAAGILPVETAIAQRFGQQYGQQDAESELLGGLASAARKRKTLNQSEEALFAGSGGAGTNPYQGDFSLAKNTAGQF